MGKSLFRYCGIALYLALQHRLYIRKIRYLCKFIDSLHGKLHGIQQLLCIPVLCLVQHTHSILFNTDDIGMLVLDTYQNRMQIPRNFDTNLQSTAALLMMHIHRCLFKKCFHLYNLFCLNM